MEFNAETPKSEVTIQDNKFNVPQPFSKGHACTENESAALNQILVENTRNNFAKRVKTAVENGTFNLADMQTELDKYLAGYEFGVKTTMNAVIAPICHRYFLLRDESKIVLFILFFATA